jgi:hypothetical protein
VVAHDDAGGLNAVFVPTEEVVAAELVLLDRPVRFELPLGRRGFCVPVGAVNVVFIIIRAREPCGRESLGTTIVSDSQRNRGSTYLVFGTELG